MSIILSRHIFKWRVSKTKAVYLASEEDYEPFILERGENEAVKYTLGEDESTTKFPIVSAATTSDVDEDAIIENINNIGVMDYNIAFKKMLKLLSYDPDGVKMVFNDYFSYYNVYDNVSMPTEKEVVKFPLDVIVRSYGESGATVYKKDDKEVLDITGEKGEDGYTVYLTNPMLYPSRKSTMTNSGNTFYTDVIVFKGNEDVSNEVTVDQSELEHGKRWDCDEVEIVGNGSSRRISIDVMSGTTEEELTRHYGYVDIPVKHNDFETTIRWNYEIVELLLASGTSIFQTYSSITQSFENELGQSTEFIITADGINLSIANSATSASAEISLAASGLMIDMKNEWNSITLISDAARDYGIFQTDLTSAQTRFERNVQGAYDYFDAEIGNTKRTTISTASATTTTFINEVTGAETIIDRTYSGFSFVVKESGQTITNFVQSASTFTGDFFDGPLVQKMALTVISSADTYVYKTVELAEEKDPRQNGYEITIKNAAGINVAKQALSGLEKYNLNESSLDDLANISPSKPFAITIVGTNYWKITTDNTNRCYFLFNENEIDENTGLSINFCLVSGGKKDLDFVIDVYKAHSALTEYGHFRLGCDAIEMLHDNISGYCSSINISADTIERRVSNLEGDVSLLRQNANSIVSTVEGYNERLGQLEKSIISVSADTNYFSAAKIKFNGYTSINGGVIIDKDGKLTLNDVEFDGVMSERAQRLSGGSGDTEYTIHECTSVYCPVSGGGESTKVYLPCEPYYNGRTITVINSNVRSYNISGTTQILAGRTLGKNVFASLYAEENSGYTLNNDDADTNYCVFTYVDGSSVVSHRVPYNNFINPDGDKVTDAIQVGWSLCGSLGYNDYEKGDPLKVYGEEEGEIDINWQFGNIYENGGGLADEINISNESIDLTGGLSNRKGILLKYQYEITDDGAPFVFHSEARNVKMILPVLKKIRNNG